MVRSEGAGPWGERLAAAVLRKKGYRLREKNFRCRFGEIDLIVENGAYLVFAEVKLRKDDSHGMGREFVTPAKQERLRQTAALYLAQNPTDLQPRFDVVEILAPRGVLTLRPRVIHLEDAFL